MQVPQRDIGYIKLGDIPVDVIKDALVGKCDCFEPDRSEYGTIDWKDKRVAAVVKIKKNVYMFIVNAKEL